MNKTDADIEYFKKFVNHRDEIFWPVKKPKKHALLSFLLCPTFGIVLSFNDWLNFVSLRVVLIAIMVGGIVCTITSDKLFSRNRGDLFLTWLGTTGLGITFFSIGMAIVYGRLNILIFIFISIHIVIVIVILRDIVDRVSNREIYNENAKKVRFLYNMSCLCFFGVEWIALVIEGVNENYMILASIFMIGATALWIDFEKLFKLYYAIKYNIDVVSARDSHNGGFGLSEKYHCPLSGKLIEERLCVWINYGNEKMLKQKELNAVKKELNMTSEEIKKICKDCMHFPL